MKVTLANELKVEMAVLGHRMQHVVEEPQAGVDLYRGPTKNKALSDRGKGNLKKCVCHYLHRDASSQETGSI